MHTGIHQSVMHSTMYVCASLSQTVQCTVYGTNLILSLQFAITAVVWLKQGTPLCVGAQITMCLKMISSQIRVWAWPENRPKHVTSQDTMCTHSSYLLVHTPLQSRHAMRVLHGTSICCAYSQTSPPYTVMFKYFLLHSTMHGCNWNI